MVDEFFNFQVNLIIYLKFIFGITMFFFSWKEYEKKTIRPSSDRYVTE